MPSVSSLLKAHIKGDAGSLQALGVALAAVLVEAGPPPVDPVELWDAVETRDPAPAGTWQEVRAARDHGDLSHAEYDYLAAAVEALTREDDR